MDIELLVIFLVCLFGGLISASLGLILVSSLIMQYMPGTRLAKWLESVWLEPEEAPDEIFNPRAGDCISPRNGKYETVIKK